MKEIAPEKHVKRTRKNKTLQVELECLKRLEKYDNHFPKILDFYDDKDKDGYCCIEMSYCGKNCDKKLRSKIPDIDWQKQIDYIINALKQENIIHMDVMRKNVCMLNNNIYLIDYGIATLDEEFDRMRVTRRRKKTHHINGDYYAYIERSLKRCLKLIPGGKL